jgi:autotransporter-associated beta strand protein
MENLGRGVVAVRTNSTTAYVGWRMLGTDPDTIGFNLYRSANGGPAVQLTTNQTQTTDFVDTTADLTQTNSYFVRPVIGGSEQAASVSYVLTANTPIQQYISIPLSPPPGGTSPASCDSGGDPGGAYTYSANDCSAADLDGDGEYEIIVKWDPSNAHDNSQDGHTGPVYLDAYKLNGTRLWRINLGKNIRAGAHYTQFMVYDFDGDGKAELACKTAPGTIDGQGNNVLMPGDDPSMVYTNCSGYILSGPEYLTIFNGQTGAAMVTTNYVPPRGNVSDWGDSYGNRVDRFLACVAYLDGQRPSLVMCRGYYTRAVLAAWDWRNGQLTQRWIFDTGFSTSSTNPLAGYQGQGDHSLSVGELDGDGKDEIVYGAAAINNDGTGLYTTGWGHGDALHLGDMDPNRPGPEVWNVHETPNTTCGGGEFRDARTGAMIFGLPSTGDTGRGCADNLITNMVGYQMWSAGTGSLFDIHGNNVGRSPGSDNFLVWWDADTSRELLDGTTISKYGSSSDTTLLSASGCSGNNGTKNTPCLSADLFGDWREEVVWRTSDNTALHIYTTDIPAKNRFYTFMHDPQYRESIAWQNVAYNQPPHTSFYMGYGMNPPPLPPVSSATLVWHGDGVSNTWDVTTTTNWYDNWQISGIWTSSTADVFNQGNSVLFDLSGSNNIPINLVGSLTASVVTVYSPIDYVFAGAGSFNGTTTVVKAGTGILTINTTNSNTGATAVRDGYLFVNGTLDQSPVTVWGSKWGLGMIGGVGRLGAGLTLQAGSGVVPGSGPNIAGTLTVSNGLTEAGGVVNYFDLSDDPTGVTRTNDLINVIGNLNLTGANTIAVNLLNGKVSTGTYPLIQYTGSMAGGVSNLTVRGLVALNYLTNLPGQIALVVLSSRASTNLFWTGSVGSSWDTNASSNWWNGASSDRFYPFDSVTFTNSAVTSLSLVGDLNPGAVIVNATVNYTFAGNGTISGSTGLTKTNTGMLTISTTNDYTGVTFLNGGTLSVARVANGGIASAIGAATNDPTSLVIDAGTFRYTGVTASTDHGVTLGAGGGTIEVTSSSAIFTIGGSVGSGGITKIGSGALSLGSANSFSGGVALNAGTLTIGDANAVGSGILTLNAGTLNNNATIANSVNAGGTVGVNTGTTQWNGPVTGSGTLSFNTGTTTATFTLNGNWSAFAGTVNHNTGYLRWYSGSNCLGSSNAAFNLGSSTGVMNIRNAGTINLGALSGGAATVLTGASSVNAPTYYVIGGRNVDSTYSGRIADGGGGASATTVILKVGSGTFTLSGTNSYAGGTTVNGGTLLVNNAKGSGTGSGTVVVATSGRLGGTGVIVGSTTINGTLAPGNNGIGTLTISNNLVVNPGATLAYELGTSSDRTLVSGNLTLGGTLNISNAAGFTMTSYTLFTYGGALTYNGISIGTAPAGYSYGIDTSTAGQVKLLVGPPLTAWQQWQANYFGSTSNPAAAPDADPLGKGMSNTNQFQAGLNPTNSASALRIIAVVPQSNDVLITWTTAGMRTNVVQSSAGDGVGGYANSFKDLSGPITIPGTGDTTTNYVDVGGATNSPSRFYRIRLMP